MKKRRIAIASFLLLAVLVMGIGFAALVETLNLTGTATYRPTSVVETDVSSAIKFISADPDGDYCISATVIDDDNADMTVIFNDAGVADTFVAKATYIVKYDAAADSHLPSVALDAVAAATLLGSTDAAVGFDVKVDHNHLTEPAVENMFSPGEEMEVIVTVTCDATEITNQASNTTANISVALNYNTADLGSAS